MCVIRDLVQVHVCEFLVKVQPPISDPSYRYSNLKKKKLHLPAFLTHSMGKTPQNHLFALFKTQTLLTFS